MVIEDYIFIILFFLGLYIYYKTNIFNDLYIKFSKNISTVTPTIINKNPPPQTNKNPPQIITNSNNPPVIDITTRSIIPYINGIPKLNINNLFVLDSTNYEPDYKAEGGTSFDYPNNGNYLLYNSTTNIPMYNDIVQSGLEDCMMDATFAAFAIRQPNFIKNHIFQDAVDKNIYYILVYYKNILNPFLVRMNAKFPIGDNYDKFVLDKKTQKPIIWSHLYLKVLAILINNFFPDFAIYSAVLPLKGYDYIAKYDWNRVEIFNLMTGYYSCLTGIDAGYNIEDFVSRFNDNNLIFQSAAGGPGTGKIPVNKNNIQIGYIDNETDYSLQYHDNTGTLKNEIIVGHGYTLIRYDANTQMVTLRNPWGVSANLAGQDNDGIFTIPLQLFFLICKYVDIGSINNSINNSNKPIQINVATLLTLINQ